MESLYVVFGDYTKRVADYLSKQGHEILGTDRTLDAAAIMASNLDKKPDTYLILGSALVSGVVDVGINYGAALLENLRNLRCAAPNSRIVLILPEAAEPEVIQGTIYMGIYDIHEVKQISISQIPELLSQRKSYADYGVKTLPMPTKETGKSEVEIDDSEEKSNKISPFKALMDILHNIIGAFTIRRGKHREQKCISGNVQNVKDSGADKTKEEVMPEKDLEKTQGIEVEDIRKQSMPDKKKVLCLGLDISAQLAERGIEVVSDPENAQVVLSNINGFYFAPKNKDLIVLGTGTIADFSVKTARPDAYIAENIEDALAVLNCGKKIDSHEEAVQKKTSAPPKAEYKAETKAKVKPAETYEEKKEERSYSFAKQTLSSETKPSLTVLPGRASSKGHTISFNSALYVVCPSRPGKAGDRAAAISKKVNKCAFVCAASGSMGAISLGIPAKDLICKDWRVPGSNAPVEWGGILVWPVDPYKFLKVNESPNGLIEGIKHKFPITVVDCAGDMELVSGVSNNDGIIVLYDQAVDPATSYWLKNYAGRNVVSASVSEAINIIPAENGYLFTKQEEKGKEARFIE